MASLNYVHWVYEFQNFAHICCRDHLAYFHVLSKYVHWVNQYFWTLLYSTDILIVWLNSMESQKMFLMKIRYKTYLKMCQWKSSISKDYQNPEFKDICCMLILSDSRQVWTKLVKFGQILVLCQLLTFQLQPRYWIEHWSWSLHKINFDFSLTLI